MIQIDNRYLKDEEIRNNTTVRAEVLASVFVNNYIQNNDTLIVGTDTNESLPDIFNESKTCGFEVVECEALIDFLHKDVIKELVKINFDYEKYLEIKKCHPEHIFNKVNLNLTVINNRIGATSTTDLGHSVDWMIENYKNTLHKKLKKLNNGDYKNCLNVSLIILNLSRANGIINAEQVMQSYCVEAKNFTLLFNYIYYVTTNGIYLINTNKCERLKFFNDDEFSICVKEMKKLLKIDEFKTNNNN